MARRLKLTDGMEELFNSIRDSREEMSMNRKAFKTNKSNGGKIMETKSRYSVIAELEEKKRKLINERDSFEDKLKEQERELRDMKREVEDKADEIKDFKDSIKTSKETIKELIRSVDDSLNRFAKLESQKK